MRFIATTAVVVALGVSACRDGKGSCVVLPPELDGGVDFGMTTGGLFTFTLGAPAPTLVTFSPLDPPFSITPSQAFVRESTLFAIAFHPTDPRLQLATTTFSGGDGCPPQTVPLRGAGTGGVVGPAKVDFGEVTVGVLTTRTVRVFNTLASAVTLEVSFEPFPFRAGPPSQVVAPMSSADVDVSLMPTSGGPINGTLVLRAGSVPAPTINITANALSRIVTLVPASVRVDHAPLRTTGASPLVRHVTVTESPPISAPLITTITPNDGSLGVVAAVDGGVADLSFLFTPQRVGENHWTVWVDGAASLDVSANGEDLTPCASAVVVSPPSWSSSGNLPLRAQLTVTNPTVRPCLVDDLRLEPAGPWRIESGESQLVLDGGASVVVVIDAQAPVDGGLRFTTWGAGETVVPMTFGP